MFSSVVKIGVSVLLLMTGGAADTFTLHGRVTDASGALIAGAEIRATNTGIRLPRLAMTDPAGMYSLSRLAEGQYVITAESPGFIPGGKQFELKAGSATTLDFTLNVAMVCPGSGCEPSTPTPESIRTAAAEHIVERMWDFSMQMQATTPGNGNLPLNEQRRRETIRQLHQLGKDAIPALALALKDPDAQLRGNAALAFVDLASGLSEEARPKLDLRDALPALTEAVKDPDSNVRAWASQAIKQIQK